MDILQILFITLHITQVFTRKSKSKKHVESSDEDSIENLLYYKDCQHKANSEVQSTTLAEPVQLRYEPPPQPLQSQPECRFPKMCCALTCGNECGNNQPSPMSMARQFEPMESFPNMPISQPMQPIPQPRQPLAGMPQPHLRRKKKIKMGMGMPKMQIPMGPNRRDFGFTKEKIKSLISQDDDIRKILKDLVRVTMQKVDLQNMMTSRRSGNDVNPLQITTPGEHFYEYDEL